MKKFLIMFFCMALSNSNIKAVERVDLNVKIIDESHTVPSVPKSPLKIPCVFYEGHTLYLPITHPEFLISIVKDEEFVFTSVIPSEASAFELPNYLEGECQIQLACGNICFVGLTNL